MLGSEYRRDGIHGFPEVCALLWLLGAFSLGLWGVSHAEAGQTTLKWKPSPSIGVEGYRVYIGEASGVYTRVLDAESDSSCTITDLEEGKTYYFAVTARDGEGNESGFSEEIFYPGVNIAPHAKVEASSENIATKQTAVKAVDGVADGWPGDWTREWATLGEQDGAWITLSWDDLHAVNRVVLHDRPSLNTQVLSATLHFSDGSIVGVGPLADDGSPTNVTFPVKSVNQVTLIIDAATGSNIGLSEIEIFGDGF